jgi:hypothetical protein
MAMVAGANLLLDELDNSMSFILRPARHETYDAHFAEQRLGPLERMALHPAVVRAVAFAAL